MSAKACRSYVGSDDDTDEHCQTCGHTFEDHIRSVTIEYTWTDGDDQAAVSAIDEHIWDLLDRLSDMDLEDVNLSAYITNCEAEWRP